MEGNPSSSRGAFAEYLNYVRYLLVRTFRQQLGDDDDDDDDDDLILQKHCCISLTTALGRISERRITVYL